ncbi:MAG: class I SAM-dependent methyltransferase [Alphaproteobacteria bacterium]|nr:MAG: class I SAM-dependent methyltransferase [Alphaproteobacteria bacterium]
MIRVTPHTLGTLTGVEVKADQQAILFADLPSMTAEPLSDAETTRHLAEIDDIIRTKRFRVIGAGDDRSVWDRGWGEVADATRQTDHVTIETLKPQYFHNEVPLRFDGRYVRPTSDYFEYYAGIAIRRQAMLTYLNGCSSLLELGCGTGLNLLLAAELFGGARLAGTDWARPTLDLLGHLGRSLGRGIDGRLLDFFADDGWASLPITPETDILTCHALEQVGDRVGPVLDRLIASAPRRCLHLEPVLEFYDQTAPLDAIAARYHQTRGYLAAFWPHLQAAEAAGRIRILAAKRVKLGNLYHEAYSTVVWEPAR